MYKWTDEDHELVQILSAQGLTVAQISSETGLSVGGVKRSRAVNRGYPQLTADPKPQQPVAESQELLQLRVRVEKLEAYVSKLERSKAKRESEEEYTGFQFKRT